MTWTDYLPLAEKTLSTQFHCDDLFHQNLLHAVIGALTEVEEILQNYSNGQLVTDPSQQGSIAEETADIFWYLSILYRELNIEHDVKPYTSNEDPFSVLIKFTTLSLSFLDILKKKIYYNKEANTVTMKQLSVEMYDTLMVFCQLYNTDVSVILDKNIAKLRARYGEKFSSERAINRDLEQERNILES
jgi:NTP pyrophosphatase (non-canonical NTP hydrolase)